MPLNFGYELNFSSFEQFAESNAKYAFMQALTATHDSIKSEKLAAKALFGVLKNKKHFEADDNPINEHTAIDLALRSLLSKKEKDMLDSASSGKDYVKEFLEDDDNSNERFVVYPPDEACERRIISKACAKAESITPRYAPMYTGTKSGIILLIVLIFICGAIYFIWSDPTDILNSKAADSDTAANIVSIPNSNNLIDVTFVPGEATQGNVPVQIYLTGPDSSLVTSVTYSPEYSSLMTSAYQCGDEYWVMMASSNNYYKVDIKGTNGLDVVRYFRVSGAIPSAPEVTVAGFESFNTYNSITVSVNTCDGTSEISSSDIINVDSLDDSTYVLSVPIGAERTFYFSDGSGNQTTLLVTGDGKTIISPIISVKEISIGHDSSKTFDLSSMLPNDREYSISVLSESENLTASVSSDNILTITALNGFVGVDSIKLSIVDNYNLSTSTSIPVIISNSAPYYADPTQLYASVLHTPSNSGYLFGTLSATDAQNDQLTYSLSNQTDCSVALSPSGSFMLFIDPDYRGHSVSFDFTVSDGLLSSEQYRYTISLFNNIIDAKTYTQEFVCYAGENGWYTIDLPKVDIDGDILNWSVTTTLTDDNKTPEGNYIAFADGLSTVLLRVNPERNENFTETLSLTCSDGWLISDTITVKCKFIKNTPPKAGKNNHSVIDSSELKGTFTLDIKDDCEFDKCVITEVISCSSGTVIENIGWNTLTFTIEFNSTLTPDLINGESINITEPVTVVLLVEDIVTKETIEVEYTITRETVN